MSSVYLKYTIAALFSSRSDTPFIASLLIRSSIVTELASADHQRLGSLDDKIFVAKLSRVRN